MEAKGARKRWTYSEYARLPESGSTRYEIIDDELVVTPSPTLRHQRIVMRLSSALHTFAQEHDVGEVFPALTDVLFAEGDFVQPDILFVGSGRTESLSDRGVEGPPDLVIEVLSPSTASRDRGVKLDRYRLYGVPEAWLVDPDERTVEVRRLADDVEGPDRYDQSDVLEWTPEPGGPTLALEVEGILGA